jgi:hypothetical protein
LAGATVTKIIPPSGVLPEADKDELAAQLGVAAAECKFEINVANDHWPGLTVSCRLRTAADPPGD